MSWDLESLRVLKFIATPDHVRKLDIAGDRP